MKALTLLLVFALPISLFAQRTTSPAKRVIDVNEHNGPVFLTTVRNLVFTPDKYVRVVDGSPYFTDYWLKSNFVQGEKKEHVWMRIDLLANEVHYMDEDGQEMISLTPIKNLLLVDTIENKQYHFLHSSALQLDGKITDGWYQQLIVGKVSLYKYYSKQISERLPYGQATVEQKIATYPHYYLVKDGELVRVKKFQELEQILVEKSKEIGALIKTKNLQGKSDDDYYQVITLFNQLGR